MRKTRFWKTMRQHYFALLLFLIFGDSYAGSLAPHLQDLMVYLKYAPLTEKSPALQVLRNGVIHVGIVFQNTDHVIDTSVSEEEFCHIDAPQRFSGCSWDEGQYHLIAVNLSPLQRKQWRRQLVETYRRGYDFNRSLIMSKENGRYYCSELVYSTLRAAIGKQPFVIRSLSEIWQKYEIRLKRGKFKNGAFDKKQIEDAAFFLRRLYGLSKEEEEIFRKTITGMQSKYLRWWHRWFGIGQTEVLMPDQWLDEASKPNSLLRYISPERHQ